MGGVFHSMVTQGHVSINRFLSTVHSYLGLFRSHGQRVFVQLGEEWHLLDTPSAFEMSPDSCRWIYRHDAGEISVRAEAKSDPHALTLSVEFTAGTPARCLISHHVALNGDDGSAPVARCGGKKAPTSQSQLCRIPMSGVASRKEAFVSRRHPARSSSASVETNCSSQMGGRVSSPTYVLSPRPRAPSGLRIRGHLLSESVPAPIRAEQGESLIPEAVDDGLRMQARCGKPLARIADIVPWFAHNALVHYLSPRGLEQYSGGGWGTRDVCQGPVEMLLALGRVQPIRDVLLRVMRQQNPDGDWPQWFMFFERERNIRPGDSHGDIVFWPLVVLAQYLIASGDGGVLEERVPFFDSRAPEAGEPATVWEHAQRALALMKRRVIPGTTLAAYGMATGTTPSSPRTPRCAITCAAPGP